MWLSNFRVALPDRILDHGSIRVQDGLIAEVSEAPVDGASLDGDGLLLMPGFIDMHGDMIEKEVEPRPTVEMPLELAFRDLDRRLKTAGVTTAFAAVSFSPSAASGRMRSTDNTRTLLTALTRMRNRLAVDHRVHARFEVTYPDPMEIVRDLIADGTIDLVSLMDHTPGQGQYRDVEKFTRLKQASGISRAQAEQQVLERIRSGKASAATVLGTIQTIADACRSAGLPIASHDDDTVEKVDLMRRIGARLSEFPVTAEAARHAHRNGLLVAMGAPNALRGESYSGNLSARDAHAAGVLDILAADYHPSAILPAILVLARRDPEGLAGAIRLATANPARALGLDDRGSMIAGRRADLVFADDKGIGHVRGTMVAGKIVYSDGSLSRAPS